eukprot:scaffold35241_cov73-Isochrysis_galbana.AAC.1
MLAVGEWAVLPLLGLLYVQVHPVNGLLDLVHTLQRALLRHPLGLQLGLTNLQRFHLAPQRRQPRRRPRVLLGVVLERNLLHPRLHQPPVHFVQKLRPGRCVDLHLGGGLVDQVDGLVGKEAFRDVTVG